MLVKIYKNDIYLNVKTPHRKVGNLCFNLDLEQTDYYHENERFVFIFETNIDKSREKELKAKLDTWRSIETKALHQLFHGNYFLIVIDKWLQTIQLRRDPSGVKTGYYAIESNGMYVGSIMHDVAQQMKRVEFNDEAIHQMLYAGYIIDGFSIYNGTYELEMGTKVIFDQDFCETYRNQVEIDFNEFDNELSPQSNFEKLREETALAHKGYIAKENHVLLSGGLDSIAMLISLHDILGKDEFDALSFRVRHTTQDETVYAKSISGHLGVKNDIVEIDPTDASCYEKFTETILRMNNPYFGYWIFGKLNGHPSEMYYAGQDTRLHTPAINEIDKLAMTFFNHQDTFLVKNVMRPLFRWISKLLRELTFDKKYIPNQISRNLYKAAHIFDLKVFLEKFYFQLDKDKLKKKGLPVRFFEKFRQQFQFDLKEIKSKRGLYNKLVELKWREQYIYDMRYLQDMARINNTYIAMPFYDKRLAEFSSSIPFSLATKPMWGNARFGKKRRIIYKYALRHAFRDKMNDMVFYRAKAVSSTLHLLFNGPLGKKVKEALEADLLENEDSFIRQYLLESFVDKYRCTKEWQMGDMDYLKTIYYIASLCIYNKKIVLAKKRSLEKYAVAA